MSTWRNTIWCEANPESPNERWGHGVGSSMQRKVIILDGSLRGRMQAAYDFLGYQVVINPNNDTPYIHRVPGMPYPTLPGNTFQLANNLEPAGVVPPDMTNRMIVDGISKTEPAGASEGLDLQAFPPGTAGSNYQRAKLYLECVNLPYAVLDDQGLLSNAQHSVPNEGVALAKGWQFTRYISKNIDSFNRVFIIPYGKMAIEAITRGGSNKQDPTGLPFNEGGERRTYTWMRVPLDTPNQPPGVNFGKIESALGTVNNATFDGALSETLLLDSVGARFYRGAFGEWLADVAFNMILLPHPATGDRQNGWQAAGYTIPPVGPGGRALNAGVPCGWNYRADIDASGLWDYWLIGAAKNLGKDIFGNNVMGLGSPPYRRTDFSTLFSP